MNKRTPALMAIAVGLAASPVAFGQALGPADFAVNIPAGPAVGGPPADFNPTVNCTPPLPTAGGTTLPSPGPYVCPNTYLWSDSGAAMNGTVTRLSDGQQGTLTGKCDWNMTNTMEVSVTLAIGAGFPPTVTPSSTVTSFGGTGGQACAWEISFGADTIIGTMSGTSTLDQPNPTTGRFTGNLKIIIVGGTGIYALANGSGEMIQQQEFPLEQPAAPPVKVGMEGRRGEAQTGSSMNMRLTKGKPKATFLVPGGAITKSTNYNVHLGAAPKSKCSIVATKGSKKVTFTLKDKKGNGDLLDSKKAGSRLGATGKWKMTATCTIQGKPKIKAFKASRTLDLRA